MSKHLVARNLSMLVCLAVLFWSGCANFIVPEQGAIAWEESRTALTDEGVESTIWAAKDLQLVYSITKLDDALILSGQLVFDRSLTDSFEVMKSFFLVLSFLDDEGRVLESVDITPVTSFGNLAPDKINIQASLTRPPGSGAITFNYFGVFRGGAPKTRGDEWSIFYFPFD